MRSLRGRLNLGILVGITLILALNSALLYMIVRARLLSELDRSLATVAQSFATQVPLELSSSNRKGDTGTEYVLSGIHLRPPVHLEDRSRSEPIPVQQLWERIHEVRADAHAILIDGEDQTLEEASWMAHLLGLQSVVLVSLGSDPEENAAQVDRLIALANRGDVDAAVVGRAVLGRGVMTEVELGALLRRVRASVPRSVRLTTADTIEAYLDHPELLGDIDFLLPIYNAFARGVHIDDAVQQIACWHEALIASARGKEVVVAEAGWPSSGDAVDAAVPSSQNAARFFTDFVTWARHNEVRYFYASGVDEPGDRGAWGYRAASGALKPGMQTVFDGLLHDLGEPAFGFLPPDGPGDVGKQSGFADNVAPFTHGVAVYLRVRGKWWNKPSFADPVTPIGCEGTWTTAIVTGEGDENAQRIIAFLLPLDYIPPELDGTEAIPQQVFETALAVAEMEL